MYKKLLLILLLLISQKNVEARQIQKLEFGNSKIEQFASDWFLAVNKPDIELLDKYMESDWDDYLESLVSLVQMKGGITPYLISYKTDGIISIYSKETNGGWVKVNLGLTKDEKIGLMGIKKSVLPVDYDLRKQVNEQEKKEIIENISQVLADKYVIPERGRFYSDELVKRLNDDYFEEFDQGDLLAEQLTKELIEISNDKHLQVIPPSRINEVIMRFGDEEASKNRDEEQKSVDVIDSRVLDQNYGLITIERFVDSKEVKLDTKKELEKIKQTEGVIIDLRSSGGGDGKAVEDLLSYFFKSDNPLSHHFDDKPIVVLTSSKTISAGEALCYEIRKRNRGTIVGQKTAGAGFLVNVFKLVYDFHAVISTDTNFDIKKGEGWQGTGITPDIEVSSQDALEKGIEVLLNKM